MDSLGSKPNYTALGKKYGMDPRTVKKYHNCYEGRPNTRNKGSKIVEKINKDMNININQETEMSPTALFYKEKEYLTPNKYKVSAESLIRYGANRYSVDPKLIGEEVTVDILNNKLYIYYNGKNINYSDDHYKKLMNGKVKKEDLDSVVSENLEMMDKLLEYRKVKVSEIRRFQENIDKYLDMIADGSKTALDAIYELTQLEISFKKEQSIKGCVKVANFPYLKEIRMLYFVVRQEWVKQTSLDELGYQRMDVDSANLFFNLIAKRYKKLSTIITTNSPFSKWADKW